MLSVLGEQDGTTVGGVAGRLALASSTVTPPLQRLERAGLVRRQRSMTDERQVEVWLTQAGRDCLIDADCLGQALIERSGIPAEAVEALSRQVQALRRALMGDR